MHTDVTDNEYETTGMIQLLKLIENYMKSKRGKEGNIELQISSLLQVLNTHFSEYLD